MSTKNNKIRLISGRSNIELSDLISKKMEIPLTVIKITDFANTETGIEIKQTVRGQHCFIIQTGCSYENRSINDHVMELLNLIHACKLSGAKSINVIMPCYAYSRSDKKDAPRVSIMASCLANLYTSLGINRLISMDLHAAQIQGFFNTIPFDNLYATSIFIEYIKLHILNEIPPEQINEQYILAAPDVGAARRIEAYSKLLTMNNVLMHKHRNYDVPGTVLNTILVGKPDAVKNKMVIIIDDIFDSFGTIDSAVKELISHGARGVYAIATHGIFSGSALDRINQNPFIHRVIVTNSIPQNVNITKCSKLCVVDISTLLATVIQRLVAGTQGISDLFI